MQSLQEALKAVKKKFGPDSVMSMGDAPIAVPSISTGSLNLDKATGIGGIPRGKITEIFGGEASGKTTIALQTIANAQKQGLACLFIDIEQSLDLSYAKQLGVNDDPNLFIFAQPSCGEEALEIARTFIESGAVGVVVVDSVAAMSPRAEIEGDISDATIGAQARLMGKTMRMLSHEVREKNVALIMLNQMRMKIGVYYGPNEDTPGGRALKYFASLRICLNQSKKEGKRGEETGHVVLARIAKNKLAPPFRVCDFVINFGTGVSVLKEMVSIGESIKLWERAGSYYRIDGKNVAQGADNFVSYLEELSVKSPKEFEKYLEACKNSTITASQVSDIAESEDAESLEGFTIEV